MLATRQTLTDLAPDPRAPTLWTSLLRRLDRAVVSHVRALGDERRSARASLVRAWPTIVGAGRIRVGDAFHEAGAILLATGTRPRRPERFPFDDRVLCDGESALQRARPPRRLAIVGASEEGCELGCLFAALGSSVLLVDRRARLLRAVDRDVLRTLHDAMKRAGIEVALEEEITGIAMGSAADEPHAVLALASGRVERCDRIAVCAGRLPNLDGLGLERLGIEADPRGFLVTDELGRTSLPGIYATGDAAGLPLELALQIERACATVRALAGEEAAGDDLVPATVYTLPEVACAGLSEEACRRLELPHATGTVPFPPADLGPQGGLEGLLKVVVGTEGHRVLGLHVVGAGAADELHAGLALLRSRGSLEDLLEARFHVPGPGVALRRAALAALGGLRTGARADPAPLAMGRS
jgi:NAD(P) transhydrogenase